MKVLLYRVVIVDISRNTRNTAFRTNVSTTTVDVDNILPCSSYEISVSSFNMFLVPGEPRTYTYTTNSEPGFANIWPFWLSALRV